MRFCLISRLALGLAGLALTGTASPEPRAARVAAAVSANGFAGRVLVGVGNRLVDVGFGGDFGDKMLARFGGAGGLAGTPRDLFAFDSALLHDKLLPAAARAAMWAGDPKLGYQALGQWSFEAPLKGCTAPVRIIERRGGIGRFQARNLILPGRDMAIIVFTNRPDFDVGEIWQGKGFSYDPLSAAACS